MEVRVESLHLVLKSEKIKRRREDEMGKEGWQRRVRWVKGFVLWEGGRDLDMFILKAKNGRRVNLRTIFLLTRRKT